MISRVGYSQISSHFEGPGVDGNCRKLIASVGALWCWCNGPLTTAAGVMGFGRIAFDVALSKREANFVQLRDRDQQEGG